MVNVLEKSMNLRALCYEHHVEMKLTWFLFTTQGKRIQMSGYRCPEPGCSVHYNSSQGYFLLNQNRGQMETDSVPRVECKHDGTLMYLAEVQLQRSHARSWECPQCNLRHLSGEGRTLKPIPDAKGAITLWRCSDCAWTVPGHSEFVVALWPAARKAFQEHICESDKDPAPQRPGLFIT
jgi:hypothetical protein